MLLIMSSTYMIGNWPLGSAIWKTLSLFFFNFGRMLCAAWRIFFPDHGLNPHPCIGSAECNHWTTREVPVLTSYLLILNLFTLLCVLQVWPHLLPDTCLTSFQIVLFCMPVLSQFSHVWLSVTVWTVACQAPLSMGFPRQEYWSGLLCPPPETLPYPGIKASSLMSPVLANQFFPTSATWKAQLCPGIRQLSSVATFALGLHRKKLIFEPCYIEFFRAERFLREKICEKSEIICWGCSPFCRPVI